ncbi:hypothetical protein P0W64_17810 [Tsukamurella sp. 8F]|uniref:hypothetical protein n=1 Tax=unclassified Tsukamurella TaxID=2633480 RepID=UPI0023B8E8D0|nr:MULTISPECIES: hypothetical protein [unclassified Tsukamurella]MDF0532612.1 hypothetical protein [Tsukamurella sp. 8J]MDF0588642.1 hypothetical protein [Tsukamurella sp. 8F]
MVGKIERNKDAAQEVVESTAVHVGRIATIISHAVADVTREIGEILTDGFEMREASRRARRDGDGPADVVVPLERDDDGVPPKRDPEPEPGSDEAALPKPDSDPDEH